MYNKKNVDDIFANTFSDEDGCQSAIDNIFINRANKLPIYDVVSNGKNSEVFGRIITKEPVYVGLYRLRKNKNNVTEVIISAIKTNKVGQYYFSNLEKGEYIIRAVL